MSFRIWCSSSLRTVTNTMLCTITWNTHTMHIMINITTYHNTKQQEPTVININDSHCKCVSIILFIRIQYCQNMRHTSLIMLPISKDCYNTFLERSFIYAAPCERNKLCQHIRTSNSGRVLKQCYLHNNLDAHWKHIICIYYCYLCCDHC